jgi:hypothetical protein
MAPMNTRDFGDLPLWRQIIIVALTPFVLPAVALLVVPLVLFLGWNSGVYCVYWLRWKLLGIPIPPKSPLPSVQEPAA